MARPKKQTVDYFPHVCNHGKTMYILEQKYGNDGYSFWFKLLEMLGNAEGHYIDLNDDVSWEFLQAKTMLSDSLCQDILNLLAKLDAIDKELWQERIVWCQKFVDGISDAYRNRRVDIPQRPSFYCKKPEPDIVSTDENPQMKLNETKLNETKEYSQEIKNFRQRYSPEQLECIDQYFDILRTTRVSGKIAESVIHGVYEDMDRYAPIVVEYACLKYITTPEYHSKKENYFAGIMRNTPADEASFQVRKIRNKMAEKPKQRAPDKFQNRELNTEVDEDDPFLRRSASYCDI